jgi:hypothetical protein
MKFFSIQKKMSKTPESCDAIPAPLGRSKRATKPNVRLEEIGAAKPLPSAAASKISNLAPPINGNDNDSRVMKAPTKDPTLKDDLAPRNDILKEIQVNKPSISRSRPQSKLKLSKLCEMMPASGDKYKERVMSIESSPEFYSDAALIIDDVHDGCQYKLRYWKDRKFILTDVQSGEEQVFVFENLPINKAKNNNNHFTFSHTEGNEDYITLMVSSGDEFVEFTKTLPSDPEVTDVIMPVNNSESIRSTQHRSSLQDRAADLVVHAKVKTTDKEV